MLVAKSFLAAYDGGTVEVVAGQTRVTRDHALARAFPQNPILAQARRSVGTPT